MDQNLFVDRLVSLRLKKGVSARDMSLSLGQSAGYINNIENHVNLPSMTVFFYICDFLNIEPKDFFDITISNPSKSIELFKISKNLSDDQLDILIRLAQDLNR